MLSGETVQNSFLDSLGEQILEDEEELEAEAREDTIARYTSPVAGFGKIEDPCFVDRLEVDVRGDYLKKILGSEGKKHELASIFPDQVVKLAVIQKLTRHGYRFDVMTILKGTGYRGSVLQFSAKEKILLNRMSKAEFELIHSREQLPLAETSTRFTNTSSLDRKSVNQMINDVTNEYFGHMQMTCEESLRAKKSHMNVSTF